MKIVVAPDSFKESLTALQVADAIEQGLKKALPKAGIIKVPMADGGEGTVQSLVDATGGKIIEKRVTGPLGKPVKSFFGLLGDGKTAVIEMAAASGIHLVPPKERNPLKTTTFGTGELMLAALDKGVEKIIIGIGGSATNDGGMGMAKALGVQFFNQEGAELGEGGGELVKLSKIDQSQMDQRIGQVQIEVACDVDNPLTGERGATNVFAEQKGATTEMKEILESGLKNYAQMIENDVGTAVDHIPGAGAAGGLGAGLLAFANAELKSGVDIVIDAVRLRDQMKEADFVITGEGKIDGQTIYGKTPIGVAKVAKEEGVPVIAIAGHLANDADVTYDHGIDALFSVIPRVMELEDALQHAATNVEKAAQNIGALLKMGIKRLGQKDF